MVQTFDQGGIRFRYPDTWKLEREETDTGWTVSVQSPETAFMLVFLREDLPTTEDLAGAALDALREDYPELESEDVAESFAGQPAVGHDIRFFSFDLTNTCWTRSFYSDRGTVLVLCQMNDLELETNEPILRAMCKSLELNDE